MAQKNRELSQFGSFLEVDNTNKNIGITTQATPYVGIGTTNPTAKLHVVGDTNVSGIISATGYYLNGNELVDAAIQTWIINDSNIYYSTGNVGIGSSIPGSKLTVAGDITVTGPITGSDLSVSGIATASRFVSTVTSGTAPLTVTSTTQVSNLNASLLAGKSAPAGDIVGTTDNQVLTNKTLTSPVISSIVNGAFTSTIPSVNGTLVSTGSTGTVTSNMIADLNIVNADVAVGAGITYGKLSLTNSILNTDIAVGAGITYGKLSLTSSITNADIATGAGISVSKLSASTISGIALGSNLATLTFGTYLTGTSYNGSTAVTIATNATSANTTSTIVARDGSGDFTAGTITATSFVGNGSGLTGLTGAGATITSVTTSSTNSAFKVPFANTTANTTGNYALLQDSGSTFTYNPSTDTLTAGTFSGSLSGTATNATNTTITNNTSTNASYYPTFVSGTSGDLGQTVSSTKLTFNPSTGTLTCTDLNSTSDINLKENIKTVENSLDTLTQLRGVSFDWKETGRSSYGVIAQELEEILPDLVNTGEVKSVNYNGIIGVLIEAVKELKKEIEELKRHK